MFGVLGRKEFPNDTHLGMVHEISTIETCSWTLNSYHRDGTPNSFTPNLFRLQRLNLRFSLGHLLILCSMTGYSTSQVRLTTIRS